MSQRQLNQHKGSFSRKGKNMGKATNYKKK